MEPGRNTVPTSLIGVIVVIPGVGLLLTRERERTAKWAGARAASRRTMKEEIMAEKSKLKVETSLPNNLKIRGFRAPRRGDPPPVAPEPPPSLGPLAAF